MLAKVRLSFSIVLLSTLLATAALAQTSEPATQTSEPAQTTEPVKAAEPAKLAEPAKAEEPAKPAKKVAEFVLRFGSINTEGTVAYDQVLVPFARAIEEESKGRIEVALKPIGGYGKPVELFPLVEKGDIEIAASVQGYHPGRFPQSSVMELPFMYENSIAGTEAMMSLYKEGLLAKDYASVKVLALYVLPPYPIFTTGKKIESVRDFRGLRMRTPSTTVGVALAKLGAVPLGIPLNMMGDTIAGGYLDAIAYGWDSVTTAKGANNKPILDQLKVAVDARLAAPALMIVMNKAKWEALPADLKTIIDMHASELAVASARLRESQEAVTKKKLQSDPRLTSLAFTDEQRAELQRVTAPAIQEWKTGMAKLGIDSEKLYARARELIQQYKVAAK
jgi:TRAP-type C4-dicarboxylate transport system substrate-binding protein